MDSPQLDGATTGGSGDASTEPPRYPPMSFGRFSIAREAGRGLGSVVYQAVDPTDQKLVALKVLYPGPRGLSTEQLAGIVEREAQKLQLLDHPNIVGSLETGVVEGHAYMVMPFIKGLALDQALAAGTMEQKDAIAFMVKVTEAVHHAHECGLIHRDLKPSNILVGKDGEPYLLDFGLSWRRGYRGADDMQSIVGTPAFMSPEQCKGVDDRLTSASDVYSLGAILYEIIAGRPPFHAATPWMTMQMAVHKKPDAPSEKATSVDPNLERVVLWCLEKDPRKRYNTALLLGEDLKRVLKGEPAVGPSVGFFSRLFGSA